MKVNLGLEIDDAERDALADYIDGKETKRLATRKDIVALVEALFYGVLDDAMSAPAEEAEPAAEDQVSGIPGPSARPAPPWREDPRLEKHRELIDKLFNEKVAAGKLRESDYESYLRGWANRSAKERAEIAELFS